MISIRNISKNKNKLERKIRITTTIRSIAIDSKDFYDMNYIRFHSGKYSSRFELDKRNCISYVHCKNTIRRMEDISVFIHDYEYTAAGDSIPALSKYLELRRKL